MNPTDEQLRRLIASNPSDTSAVKELRLRTRIAAARKLPNPKGKCAHGRRVYLDQKGVYSSGYIIHDDGPHDSCDGGYGLGVEWDPDTPEIDDSGACVTNRHTKGLDSGT